jgi:hypothetical protein
MPLSDNGFEVMTKEVYSGWPRLRKFNIPGAATTIPLRDGACGFLLCHCALWYHEEIEPITGAGDDFGWAPREIAGSNVWSNHASGTAMDLNASKHPQGQHTISDKNAAKIIKRCTDFYKDTIRWGGTYHSLIDQMHYEINKELGLVEDMAISLFDSPRGSRVLKANRGLKEIVLS